ncbi:DUF4112 domain-containing protein [Halobium salinum]|uniref:DUF4112 domain-containing protein n=1 Tax=Halobium salinum TaxID=1364940 RepID=A0ABD5PC47_9EURY|nr:DUF4112 domain-containing protein [Halobium salinum]
MTEDEIDPDDPGDSYDPEGEPIDVTVVDSGDDDLDAEFEDLDFDLPETVDREAVERMRTVARLMDSAVDVPGTNTSVGLDPVLGAIPVVGDVVSAGFSLYIVLESARLGVGFSTLLKMLANVTVDVAGGSVPYVGPLFDAVWKANEWNLEMALEELAEADADEDLDPKPEAVTIDIDGPDE